MVDAVNNNNNRNTAYTLGGVGVGALAGAGYSHFIEKPLLKENGPSDAFIKKVYENQASEVSVNAEKNAKEALAKIGKDDKGILDVAGLKAELEANPEKYGIKEIAENAEKKIEGKTVDKQIAEYLKNGETALTKDELYAKMEKSAVSTATDAVVKIDSNKIESGINQARKLAKEADDDALKGFLKNNKELFNIADDAAVDAKFTELVGTAADKETRTKAIKDAAEGFFADAKKSITDNWDSDKKGLKALAEGATDNERNLMSLLKKSASHVQRWSAAKWAGIGAAVLGVAAYIGAKMTQPKPELPPEEAAQLEAHQA